MTGRVVQLIFNMVVFWMLCFLQYTDTYKPPQNVQIHNNASYQSVIKILEVLKWENVVLFYDSALQCETIAYVEDYLRQQNVLQTVFDVTRADNSSLSKNLQNIHEQHFPHVHVLFISCSTQQQIARIFQFVNNYDFISNRTTDFRSKSHWILVTSLSVTKLLEETILDLCHVVYVQTGDCFMIKTLQKTARGIEFSSVSKLLSPDDIFPNIKYNFNGRKMLLGSFPFQFLVKNTINNVTSYGGPVFNILKMMQRFLNFTCEFWEPAHGDWGIKLPNDTYTGLLGKVQQREIDILYAEYIVNNERSKIMDFIYPPFITTSMGIIYKKPEINNNDSWLSIFKPFQPEVYVFLSLAFIIFSTLYVLIETFPVSQTTYEHTDGFTIVMYLFSIFGCLVSEGSHIKPRTRNGQILVSTWWIFCVIFAAVYSANLTSSLLLRIPEKVFTNLKELSLLSDWKFGVESNSGVLTIFQDSPDELLRNMWNQMVEFNKTDPSLLSEDPNLHLEKALQGKYAFIRTTVSSSVMSRNDCLLSFIENVVSAQQISFGVPLNSPLKRDLNRFMEIALEEGILNDELKKDLRPFTCRHNIKQPRDHHAKPIYLDNIKGAFIVLAFGILFSSCELILEFILSKWYT